MQFLTILGVFGLVVGGLAAPTTSGDDYNAECGAENGVSKSEWNEFSLFDDEFPSKMKCYIKCDFERDGIFKDGKFTDTYLEEVSRKAEQDDLESIAYTILKSCAETIESTEPCDIAGEYSTCVGVSTLALSIFASVLEELSQAVEVEPVTEKVLESENEI